MSLSTLIRCRMHEHPFHINDVVVSFLLNGWSGIIQYDLMNCPMLKIEHV